MLPTAVTYDHADLANYVKTRNTHNKRFFDDVRAELMAIIKGLRVQMVVGLDAIPDGADLDHGLTSVLRSLLQALHVAKAFLASREQHSTLVLGHLCLDLADHLSMRIAPGEQLFWQVLTRLCLGNAFAKFKKFEEGTIVLQEGIRLCQSASAQPGSKERAIEGACHMVLCRIQLDAALDCKDEANGRSCVGEAAAAADKGVVLLEMYLHEAPGYAERREDGAGILATAYSSRGVCDVRAHNYEGCFQWFTKAQAALQAHKLFGTNGHLILQQVAEQIEHAQNLQRFS